MFIISEDLHVLGAATDKLSRKIPVGLKTIFRSARDRYKRPPKADPYNLVKLISWKPGNGSLNFGDMLSKVVVSKILSDLGRSLDDEVKISRRLLAIGSIMHFASSDDVVWGSGVNGTIPNDFYNFENLDVRSVRGPLTAEFLHRKNISVPDVYGDPALLLPRLFPNRFSRTNRRSYVIVPNLHDLEIVREWPNVVSPLSGWNRCITTILEANLVIASSLHGIIVAEAYGIPARMLRVSQAEALLKYQDYYEGTGRNKWQFAKNVQEALAMGGMEPAKFDSNKILNAFPMDLWG